MVGLLSELPFVLAVRRTTLPKATFNLGLFTAEVTVAALLFHALHAGNGLQARDWLVAYRTTLLVTSLGAIAVTAGMAVQQGRMAVQQGRMAGSELARTLPVVGLAGVLNTTFAPLSLLALHVNRGALLLLGAAPHLLQAVEHHSGPCRASNARWASVLTFCTR